MRAQSPVCGACRSGRSADATVARSRSGPSSECPSNAATTSAASSDTSRPWSAASPRRYACASAMRHDVRPARIPAARSSASA
ncbi:hypothetical protein ACFSTC_63130 [Nonomuraea ferruginea]